MAKTYKVVSAFRLNGQRIAQGEVVQLEDGQSKGIEHCLEEAKAEPKTAATPEVSGKKVSKKHKAEK